jgi:putative transposase
VISTYSLSEKHGNTRRRYERNGYVTADLPRFIDRVYNVSRLHSALGYAPGFRLEDQQARQAD